MTDGMTQIERAVGSGLEADATPTPTATGRTS